MKKITCGLLISIHNNLDINIIISCNNNFRNLSIRGFCAFIWNFPLWLTTMSVTWYAPSYYHTDMPTGFYAPFWAHFSDKSQTYLHFTSIGDTDSLSKFMPLIWIMHTVICWKTRCLDKIILALITLYVIWTGNWNPHYWFRTNAIMKWRKFHSINNTATSHKRHCVSDNRKNDCLSRLTKKGQ